jgi:uncharacterized protein (DUF1330 family)
MSAGFRPIAPMVLIVEGEAMPAYLIARVQVNDAAAYEEYKRLAAAAIEKFGGRYRARGGTTVTLEGAEEKSRVVIVEFDSLEKAKEWYGSKDYQKAIAARSGCATVQFLVVDGIA